jgi:hypothetical protein
MEVCHLVPGRESFNSHKPYPARRCLCPFGPHAGCYIATWAARFSPLSRPTRRCYTATPCARGHWSSPNWNRALSLPYRSMVVPFNPCVGVLHRLHPLHRLFDFATVSITPEGATLLRHAHSEGITGSAP